MKTNKGEAIIDRTIRMQREANRQALVELASSIPSGEVYLFPKAVGVDSKYEGKITYHSADRQYVFGIDEHGNALQVEHASNSFYSPVIHRILKAVDNAIKDAKGEYAHKEQKPLKRQTIGGFIKRK